MTAANADEWVYVEPGLEGLLARSIAAVLIEDGLAVDTAAQALTGDDTAGFIAQFSPEQVAARLNYVTAERIREIAHEFADHQPGVAIAGGSAGAHTNGSSNLAAIYALNSLVGNVGQTGGVILNPSPAVDAPAASHQSSFAQDAAARKRYA